MLFGREKERAILAGAIERRSPLVVVGEAGIGKTALVRSALVDLPAGSVACNGLATLAWMPYAPLLEPLGGSVPEGDAVAVAGAVAEAIGDRVLMLDDAHWMDPDTLATLPYLAGQVLLIATVRRGDPGAVPTLTALGAIGAERLELDGLPASAAQRLLAQRRPTLSAGDREEIAAAAAGNPFLLEELEPGGGASGAAELVIAASLDRLSGAGREAVARLALLGRPADPALAGPAALEGLDAGLLVLADGAVVLRHALVGEAALDRLEQARAHEIRGELADVLEPGEAARQLADAGRAHEACERALAAADMAGNLAERGRHLALAAVCAEPGPDADAMRLEAAEAAFETGHPGEALELVTGFQGGLRADRARARTIEGLAHFQLGEHGEAERAANQALALAGGELPDVRAEALRIKAVIKAWDWDGPAGRPFAEEALQIAEADGRAVARSKLTLARTLFATDLPASLALSHEAAALARAEGDGAIEMDAAYMLAAGLGQVGDPEAAYALSQQAVVRARELGQRRWEYHQRFVMANLSHCSRGDHEAAVSGFRDVLRSAAAIGENRHRAKAGLAVALAELGRDAEALDALEIDVGDAESIDALASLAWSRGEVHWLAGRPAEALAAATAGMSLAANPYTNMSRVTFAWAILDLERGDPVPEPADVEMTLEGNLRELHALAALRGAPAEAEPRFLEASEAWRGAFVSASVRCLWAGGEAAALTGAEGRAREHLREAAAIARQLGLMPYLARIRRSLRAVGIHGDPLPRRRAGSASTGLSAREEEVLDLVGQGLTSREIATRLGTASSTVDSQVKSAMRKLDVRTRRQAVLAARAERDDAG